MNRSELVTIIARRTGTMIDLGTSVPMQNRAAAHQSYLQYSLESVHVVADKQNLRAGRSFCDQSLNRRHIRGLWSNYRDTRTRASICMHGCIGSDKWRVQPVLKSRHICLMIFLILRNPPTPRTIRATLHNGRAIIGLMDAYIWLLTHKTDE